MKRYLIVNADDFGLCAGVNLGILTAHKEGIVTATSLMVNQAATQEAFELAKQTPSLAVGIHFVLTSGRPVADGVESLTGPDGRFLRPGQLVQQARPEHIRKEMRAQLELFLASGLTPTHMDSHHNIHCLLPAAEEAIMELALELGVPVRHWGFQKERFAARGVKTSDHMVRSFYGESNVGVQNLEQILTGLEAGVTEINCHPAFLDHRLGSLSSYSRERVMELATLTDPRIRATVEKLGIELTNYGRLHSTA